MVLVQGLFLLVHLLHRKLELRQVLLHNHNKMLQGMQFDKLQMD